MLNRKPLLRVMSLLLIALFLSNVIHADFAHIIQNQLPFEDVPLGAWFYGDVKSAYDSNLINGKTETKFAPDDNMTAAEAVKLAACMHQLKKEGAINFQTGIKPWYKPYVDYAKANNLISGDLPWDQNINRAGYMQIFAQIIMGTETNLNDIPEGFIPDVKMTHPNAPAIYKLYQAGIVQGVDAEHNCRPASFIKRSEVAAILTRMMHTDQRLVLDSSEELTITKQPNSFTGKLGAIARLEVEVQGGKAPLSYQWEYRELGKTEFKNTGSEGNTTSVLNPPVEEAAGEYRCVITDAKGKQVISEIAKVEQSPFSITKQTKKFEGNIGDMAELRVEISGGKAPFTYQWQYRQYGKVEFFNSVAVGNKTDVLKVAVENRVYDYRCVIRDANGQELISDTARVSIPDLFATFTKQPEDFTGNVGDKVELKVEIANAKEPYTYQWQYLEFGKNMWVSSIEEGNTTNTLKTKVEDKIGFYRCVIKDSFFQTYTSDTVRVDKHSDDGDFKIVKQPEGKKGNIGDKVSLKVELEGGRAPFTYQWEYVGTAAVLYRDSTGEGNKTDTLTIAVEMPYYDYRCIITDADGNKLITKPARVEMK